MGRAKTRVEMRDDRARELAGAVVSYLELDDDEFEGNLVKDAVEAQRVEGRAWSIYARHRSYCRVEDIGGGACTCGLAELLASVGKGPAEGEVLDGALRLQARLDVAEEDEEPIATLERECASIAARAVGGGATCAGGWLYVGEGHDTMALHCPGCSRCAPKCPVCRDTREIKYRSAQTGRPGTRPCEACAPEAADA